VFDFVQSCRVTDGYWGTAVSPEVPDVHEMIPAERRARIVELVRERRAVRVSALSEDLGRLRDDHP